MFQPNVTVTSEALMRPHIRQRHRRWVVRSICTAAWVATPLLAHAATDLWDGGSDGSGSAYLDNANWNPDLVSGTGPGVADTAQFDLAGTASTIGIDFGAANTNNGLQNQSVGQILLNDGISRAITNSSITSS